MIRSAQISLEQNPASPGRPKLSDSIPSEKSGLCASVCYSMFITIIRVKYISQNARGSRWVVPQQRAARFDFPSGRRSSPVLASAEVAPLDSQASARGLACRRPLIGRDAPARPVIGRRCLMQQPTRLPTWKSDQGASCVSGSRLGKWGDYPICTWLATGFLYWAVVRLYCWSCIFIGVSQGTMFN